jgi:hypothetical protein
VTEVTASVVALPATEVTASLPSPNVAPVLASGFSSDGSGGLAADRKAAEEKERV